MASQNKHKSSDYTLNTCPDMRGQSLKTTLISKSLCVF